jgi:hypothetical protein
MNCRLLILSIVYSFIKTFKIFFLKLLHLITVALIAKIFLVAVHANAFAFLCNNVFVFFFPVLGMGNVNLVA